MPGPSPIPVELSLRQRAILASWVRRQTTPQRLVRRASIVLGAADGMGNQPLADQLHLSLNTIRTWRQRWQAAQARLQAIEAETACARTLATQIEAVLTDAPRPGGPTHFTPEQIIDLIAVACEPPSESDRPISHWTPRELADEVKKRQLVDSISPRHLGRFLKRSRSETPS